MLGRRRKRADDVHKCILKTCDKPSVPQEGPFCEEHNWDDVQDDNEQKFSEEYPLTAALADDRTPREVADHHRAGMPPAPRVEVLHVRDPDADCELKVLIDGTEVTFTDVDIDPGRGYVRSDWDDSAKFHGRNPTYSERFRELVANAYEQAGHSKYIEEDHE